METTMRGNRRKLRNLSGSNSCTRDTNNYKLMAITTNCPPSGRAELVDHHLYSRLSYLRRYRIS